MNGPNLLILQLKGCIFVLCHRGKKSYHYLVWLSGVKVLSLDHILSLLVSYPGPLRIANDIFCFSVSTNNKK